MTRTKSYITTRTLLCSDNVQNIKLCSENNIFVAIYCNVIRCQIYKMETCIEPFNHLHNLLKIHSFHKSEPEVSHTILVGKWMDNESLTCHHCALYVNALCQCIVCHFFKPTLNLFRYKTINYIAAAARLCMWNNSLFALQQCPHARNFLM